MLTKRQRNERKPDDRDRGDRTEDGSVLPAKEEPERLWDEKENSEVMAEDGSRGRERPEPERATITVAIPPGQACNSDRREQRHEDVGASLLRVPDEVGVEREEKG